MAQNKFDISVLILCYNAEHFIEECVNSVLDQQTTYNYELVVVDDQSTDNSWSRLQGLQREHSNRSLTIKRNEQNLGSLGNLKHGLSLCSGKYIAYLEGDDYWVDHLKLQHQVDLLEQHNELVGVGGGCEFVNENGAPTEQLYYNLDKEKIFHNGELWNFPPFQTSTFVFRNMALNIPNSLPEDAAFNDKVLYLLSTLHGNIAYVPDVVAAYRYHQDNLSHSLDLKTIYTKHIEANRLIIKHLGFTYGLRYLRSIIQYRLQYLRSRS